MKTKPRRSTTSGWAAARRELARRDRELFGQTGHACPRVSRNDQYSHLWDRILLRLADVLAREPRGDELDALEDLSRSLAEAQEHRRLPPSLVRRVLAGTAPHVSPRP